MIISNYKQIKNDVINLIETEVNFLLNNKSANLNEHLMK
jgi:hypothetical protein